MHLVGLEPCEKRALKSYTNLYKFYPPGNEAKHICKSDRYYALAFALNTFLASFLTDPGFESLFVLMVPMLLSLVATMLQKCTRIWTAGSRAMLLTAINDMSSAVPASALIPNPEQISSLRAYLQSGYHTASKLYDTVRLVHALRTTFKDLSNGIIDHTCSLYPDARAYLCEANEAEPPTFPENLGPGVPLGPMDPDKAAGGPTTPSQTSVAPYRGSPSQLTTKKQKNESAGDITAKWEATDGKVEENIRRQEAARAENILREEAAAAARQPEALQAKQVKWEEEQVKWEAERAKQAAVLQVERVVAHLVKMACLDACRAA